MRSPLSSESISPVVDARYRLRAEEFQPGVARLRIHNVTIQGVEAMRPVVHFGGGLRPLVLDSTQCNDLARITGSAVPAEWIGQEIVIAARASGGQGLSLVFFGPDEPLPSPEPSAPARSLPGPWSIQTSLPHVQRSSRTLVTALLLFALALLLYELSRNLDWQQLQQWIR